MTFQIIHDGKGQMRRVELPVFADATVEAPRTPLAQRGVAKFYAACDSVLARNKRFEKAHTNYRPGKFIDLGHDQCRWTVSDETGTMCGAKTITGRNSSSYCADHAVLMRQRPSKPTNGETAHA